MSGAAASPAEPGGGPAVEAPRRGARPGALVWAAGLAVAVSVVFRVYALGRLPGINGDEAWYGVQVRDLLAGEGMDWRTPAGSHVAPIHTGLLVLLHAVAPPSFAVLRLPSVIVSLAQCALAWFVARRHLGPRAAGFAVVLTAVLPIDIAYARLGWDPSSTGLIAIAAAGCALSGVAWASAALFGLGLFVHPTNAFLAPFLWIAFLLADASRVGWRRAAVRSAVHGALLLAALGLLAAVLSGGTAGANMTASPRNPFAAGPWATFLLRYARLLSGDTVFQYVAGNGLGAARTPADLGVLLLLAALLAAGARRLVGRRAGVEAGIVAGWLATLVAFFLFAGPHAMQPHLERYALVLVVPTVLAVTALLRELEGWSHRPALPVGIVAACAALALAAFGTRYLAALEETGSTSAETFWTGPVEPKAEAFRLVSAATPAAGARLVAEDWWTYWPLAYLARGSPVRVVRAEEARGPPPPGGTWWVGYAGGPLERWAAARPWILPRFEIRGAGGRTVLRVWWAPMADPLRARPTAGAPR
ncbi:MAG TPA: hypothetical protein VFL83_00930 [Anaeromyxobacter sp.]|nr:hypothetical protein [Anaeromyxobacter sp.]